MTSIDEFMYVKFYPTGVPEIFGLTIARRHETGSFTLWVLPEIFGLTRAVARKCETEYSAGPPWIFTAYWLLSQYKFSQCQWHPLMNLWMSNLPPRWSLKYLDSLLPEGMRLDHVTLRVLPEFKLTRAVAGRHETKSHYSMGPPWIFTAYWLLSQYKSANVNDIHWWIYGCQNLPHRSLKYLDSLLPEGMRLDHVTPWVFPEYSLLTGYLINPNSADINDILNKFMDDEVKNSLRKITA